MAVVLLAAPGVSVAQNMIIYADSLTNGWADGGSYNVTLNYANTSPVHSGNDSISATINSAYGAIVLSDGEMSDTAYASISFWLNGGATGGQHLQMYGVLGYANQSARYSLNAPVANTWQQYTVPLSALGVANSTIFTGFAIQDDAGTAEPTFYLDDIQLVSAAGPALTHLTVNAGQSIRTADARWFGLNTAVWDSDLDTPQTVNLLTNMGTLALRFPGGSDSDDYHWLGNQLDNGGYVSSSASLANFIQVITNLNAQAMTTLNYGTGSSNEAAAWVAYVNASTANTQSLGVDTGGFNWQTAGYWASLRAAAKLGTDDGKNFLRLSRSTPLGLKYWEIGNEEYGSWETDSNTVAHDPYTYAVKAGSYISLMKAVDPTIKIGVVVTTGEDSYANNTSHPAFNPREGTYHNGWTAVLLATLKSLGAMPDFAIYHRYPENPGSENDAGLLASSTGWASDAADLRQQITDYMGSNVGTNIELLCTENNSVSSAPGKQSTSLVNGLFKADSLAQLMQTEFNGLFWWDLRNGQITNNNNSSSLYGWRLYGDFGVADGYTILYPTYYIGKLMPHFVQAGDTVVAAASDYSLLSTYAVRRQDGSLTILTINKDPVNTLTGQVAVASFIPDAVGTIYSYGIPQDNAAETSTGSPDIAQTNFSTAGTNFNYAFPPYSATVLALAPAPAKLLVISSLPGASQFVFQLQSQADIPYIIQRSTNLIAWTSVSTNTLPANTMNFTNSLAPSVPEQFWRAIWQP
jgi:alpha-L-arabinofuranosidase